VEQTGQIYFAKAPKTGEFNNNKPLKYIYHVNLKVYK
jgi:hypothetical protein